MIELDLIEDKAGRDELRGLIEKHYAATGSKLAKQMLDDWEHYVGEFIQVTPIEYRRILQEERMKALQQKIDSVQRDY
jgi:glutamate synthase (NADPH/NADH) large chain